MKHSHLIYSFVVFMLVIDTGGVAAQSRPNPLGTEEGFNSEAPPPLSPAASPELNVASRELASPAASANRPLQAQPVPAAQPVSAKQPATLGQPAPTKQSPQQQPVPAKPSSTAKADPVKPAQRSLPKLKLPTLSVPSVELPSLPTPKVSVPKAMSELPQIRPPFNGRILSHIENRRQTFLENAALRRSRLASRRPILNAIRSAALKKPVPKTPGLKTPKLTSPTFKAPVINVPSLNLPKTKSSNKVSALGASQKKPSVNAEEPQTITGWLGQPRPE